jgi:lambda repressor-like predicted transcriptional regulator
MASSDLQQKLAAARQVVTDPRLRTLSGKRKMLVEDGNVYGVRIGEEEFTRFLDKVYADEAIRQVIVAALRETPLSVAALSEKIGVRPDTLFKHLLVLQQKGQVEVARVENHAPLYRSIGAE